MRISRISVVASLAAASIGVAACGSSSSSSSSSGTASGGSSSSSGSVTVNGAGSTFAAPIYQQFSSSLGSQGLTLNYNAVGSGAGVTQLQAGTVDFAGSDPAMKDAEIKAAKGPVVHFPLGVRFDHDLLQPSGDQERSEARRRDDRGHIPR